MIRFARPLATLLAVACLAAVPTFAHAQQAPAAATPTATKIGAVNLNRVFNEIKESKDVQAKLQAKSQQVQQDTAAKQAHLKDLQGQRNQFKAGSAEYERANAALSQANVEAVVATQLAQQELIREQKRSTVAVIDKAMAVAKTLAAEKGYAMIITQTVPPDLSDDQTDRMTMEAFTQLISQRNILFVTPENDLTADLIARMDAAYNSGK